MAANIEIEAKVLINEKDYNKIVNLYKNKVLKEYDQTNYYIDSSDFELKKLGIGLRVRETKTMYELTLKAPMAEGLLEKNQMIAKDAFNELKKNGKFPSGNIKEFIQMLGVSPSSLKIITSLTTHRIEADDEDETTMFCIDKNTYNGIIDYELELEHNSLNKATHRLQEICDQTKIIYIENKISKQSRAMSSVK